MKSKGVEKFNELVESFANLPTIGRKTAIRLAYHICMANHLDGMKLAHSIENALHFIKPCQQCGALSENELCEICADTQRHKTICIVQSPKDVLTIEESGSYDGLYFVLDELCEEKILKLRNMVQNKECKELIFALTHSVSSDATIFFIEERLRDLQLEFSKIAQGIPSGINLENVDIMSLHMALHYRTKIE